MGRGIKLALPLLLWHAVSLVGQAQLVQVSPGYVKAPFVRVYSNPNGSSYVRAPFVGVYSPGYRSGGFPQGLPTEADFARMDWRSLSQAVREWSARVDADLARVPSADTWKHHLKTAEISALVPRQLDGPPADDVRQQLEQILRIHREPSDLPDASRIANLGSFQVLQLALSEYTMAPDQRPRRQLFFAARDLSRSLERFPTGGGWQRYLMLSPGMTLSEDRASEHPLRLGDVEQLRERFDSVGQNAEYAIIAALPAFKTTQQRLTAYLSQAGTSPSSTPEELPEPTGNALPSP